MLIKFKDGACFFYLHLGSCLQMRMEWIEEWRKCYGSSSKVISLTSSTRQLHLASDVFIIIPGEHFCDRCQICLVYACYLLDRIELFTEGQPFFSFLRVVCFCVPRCPPPASRQQNVSLSQSFCISSVYLTDGGGGGRGAESYDRKIAWPSINRSIPS